MQLARISLHMIRMPLVHHFETSFGRTYERRIIVVEVEDVDHVQGFGEVTCGEAPYYNEEWVDAAWMVLRDFVAPRVLGVKVESAGHIAELTEGIRGHRMARGGLEAACWELEAAKIGMPLWRHIGGVRAKIPCGVSIGIQDSLEELFALIDTELEAGYRRVKIKIKPGWDVDVVRAVRERYPDLKFMADANSAYTLDDLPHLKALDDFDLMMLEQPLGHDEIYDHATLQSALKTPICLDECIRTNHHAKQAIGLGACQVVNIKLGRVGGFAEALRIHDTCRDAGVPVWCGGMLEAGVGRAHNVALSTLQNFTLPGDVSASKRYWKQDIIEPDVQVDPDGTIAAPDDAPGLGYGLDVLRMGEVTEKYEHLTWRESWPL